MSRGSSVRALTEVFVVIVTAEVLEREVEAMKPWMGSFIRSLAERFSDVETRALASIRAKPDPAEVANLALMNLKTWGQRSREHGMVMNAERLVASIAKTMGLRENAVLKILNQYEHFEVMLTHGVIALRDDHALAAELMPYLNQPE